MKVVVNRCHGGFSVSDAVMQKLNLGVAVREDWNYIENEDFGIDNDYYQAYRADPRLVAAVEAVGLKSAGGTLASLKIVDIPDGIKWYIDDRHGFETVHEVHRSW